MIDYLRLRTGSYIEGEKVYEITVEEGIVKFKIHGMFAASAKELGYQMSVEFLKQLETIDIEKWETSYEAPVDDEEANEGSYWELEYKPAEGLVKKCFGWDAYPPQWDSLMQLINFFGTEFIVISANVKVHEAMDFAAKVHKDQKLQGSDADFITHPMEVLNILTTMAAEPDVLIAGVLHDVMEYGGVTSEDLIMKFGDSVAHLVSEVSEEKGYAWRFRKQQLINTVHMRSKEEQMIIMADMVAHLRRLYADYSVDGEKIWERFDISKEDISWYFSTMQDNMESVRYINSMQHVYWEMVDLYKDLFVTHILDAQKGRMYQIGEGSQVYMLEKSMPVWQEILNFSKEDQRDGELAANILKMVQRAKEGSQRVQIISRLECNHIEQLWLAPVWKVSQTMQ